METTELQPRETKTNAGAPAGRPARKRFDPTQLFAQRDRLPWFWFFVAVTVTVLAAFDRHPWRLPAASGVVILSF
jgi:hypothetical protein